MKENRNKFLVGMWILLAAYGLLMVINNLCIKSIPVNRLEGNILYVGTKHSVPFHDELFWMEWMLPLLLCLTYVFRIAGRKLLYRVATIATVIMSGWVFTHFYEAMRALRIINLAMKPVCLGSGPFEEKISWWEAVSTTIGNGLLYYFYIWSLIAFLLILAAPVLLKRWGKSLKSQKIVLSCICAITLSEGVLFSVVYWGQYTFFYIVRSIISLLLVLLVFYKMQAETLADEMPREEKKGIGKWGTAIGLLSLVYGIVAVLDSLVLRYILGTHVEESKSVLREIKTWCTTRSDICPVVIYLFLFFVVFACFAQAMKKKQLYAVSNIGAIVTMYLLQRKEGMTVFWMAPAVVILLVVFICLLPVLEQLFPRVRNEIGIAVTCISYGIIFYKYVYPLFGLESATLSEYRIWPYVVAQLILLIMSVLTILIYSKKESAPQSASSSI